MSNGMHGPWSGRGANLEAAFEDAWHNAKNAGASPGTYKVEISIETTNPIHTYIVIISPSG
jgi:hypothetical protein